MRIHPTGDGGVRLAVYLPGETTASIWLDGGAKKERDLYKDFVLLHLPHLSFAEFRAALRKARFDKRASRELK